MLTCCQGHGGSGDRSGLQDHVLGHAQARGDAVPLQHPEYPKPQHGGLQHTESSMRPQAMGNFADTKAKNTLVVSSLYWIVRQEEGKNDKCMHVVATSEQTPSVHSGVCSLAQSRFKGAVGKYGITWRLPMVTQPVCRPK